MAKQKTPTTFDGWLGKIIDDEAKPHGGRLAVAEWIDASPQSVNRRARGEVSYTAREVQVVAHHIGVPVAELVERALARYGGIDKLLAEYEEPAPAPIPLFRNPTPTSEHPHIPTEEDILNGGVDAAAHRLDEESTHDE